MDKYLSKLKRQYAAVSFMPPIHFFEEPEAAAIRDAGTNFCTDGDKGLQIFWKNSNFAP